MLKKYIKLPIVLLSIFILNIFSENCIVKANGEEIFTECNYKYEINDNNITLLKYVGNEKNITIPNKINGMNVNRIGSYCFYENNSIQNINVPNSITQIDSNAFARCNLLTNIKLPDTITCISKYMFYDCKNLSDIEIPNSVKTIEQFAFLGCEKLSKILIPDSVETIKDYAFMMCKDLKITIIHKNVTNIGTKIFHGCKDVKIYGDSNSIIEKYAKKNNILYIQMNNENLEPIIECKADLCSPQYCNTSIKLSIDSLGSSKLSYKFIITKDGNKLLESTFSENNSIQWIPTVAGNYVIYFKILCNTRKKIMYIKICC